LVKNLVTGVSEGFKKSLEFKGIGYRVAIAESQMTISAGYSHPIELTIPAGLTVTNVKSTIIVAGIDKYQVGEFAAKIRSVRPPEVYKGKGFRYSDEHIRIKPGKTAAKG
jgi:large subunit ribosomal protein L6